MQTRRTGFIGVLLALLPLACVGEIGGGAAATQRPDKGSPGGGGVAPPGPGPVGPPGGTGATSPSDPGRVTLRRLNRIEYDNTLRDLLGTTLRPAASFEQDPTGYGYDNNGDVQTLTSLQVEQYQSAAEAVVADLTAGGMDRLAAAARSDVCALTAADCAQKLVAGLAKRAWRRPVSAAELDRLMGVARAAKARGEDTLGQLRFALVAMLVSPHFLFRVELDPDPRSTAPHALGGYELASRLSYLLYRSMPDDALFAAAETDRLRDPADVRREVLRMLGDPKGAALIEGFAGQWLDLDALAEHQVDAELYGKAFDAPLAAAMRAETVAFFGEFLRQNLPVPGMLDARFSFMDGRLAQHYGLTATGPGLARVELDGKKRAGLITQASVLTTTSAPNRTSPIARGAWVLARLLCAPPPPPPADVPALPEADLQAPSTARALLELHRKDPSCASCHRLIDPIGLGLENYDAVGRWRDKDLGLPIDAAGELPDGAKFQGAVELGALLAKDPRVASCVAGNLFTYALSRQPVEGSADDKHVQAILRGAGRDGAVHLQDLVLAVVTSDPFRLRRGEPGTGGQP
jgi:hypothetical protein